MSETENTGSVETESSLAADAIKRLRSDWIEIAAAILLALATVSTAWCAYQSARWSGVQTASYAEANAARTESTKKATRAGQEILIDAALYLNAVGAYASGNTELQGYYQELFRPEFKTAFNAWLALDPLNNPDAPDSPFDVPEYTNKSIVESEQLVEEAEAKSSDARDANQQSDNYVLLTVLFASVLFFAGISTKFTSDRLKMAMVFVGGVVFVVGLVILFSQPVH